VAAKRRKAKLREENRLKSSDEEVCIAEGWSASHVGYLDVTEGV
jgi:hypothetical protein